MSRTEQGGLRQDEAKSLGYFGAIVAFPICDTQEKFRGCLVVEGPAGDLTKLSTDEIKDFLYAQQRLLWSTLVAGDRL
jgi:hypothetical protein